VKNQVVIHKLLKANLFLLMLSTEK